MSENNWWSAVRFGADGLVPVVAQERRSGDVLMLAYADRDALARTLSTGEAHYYSRARQGPWRKGETSGHVQRVVEVRLDCDGDAVLYRVDQTGPACHTGERTCFSSVLREDQPNPVPGADPGGHALSRLAATIARRAQERPEGSYTVKLLDDPALVGEKVEEEAEEVVRAASEESDERVAEEAADVLYHLAVLLASREVPQSAVMEVLDGRRR